MGTLYCFRFFDGTVEYIRDGGLGKNFILDFAQRYFNVADIWQVSSTHGICSGVDFFK